MENIKNYSEEVLDQVSEILFRKDKPISSENILCLGQSDNSKGVMFVLYRFNHADYSFSTGKDPMSFQCILAGDLLEAAKKARKICGIMDVSLDIEFNYARTSIEVKKRFFAEKYPEIIEMLEIDNHIIANIKYNFEKYGNLSEAQIGLVKKLYASHLEYQKKLKKEKKEQEKYAKLEQFYFTPGERVELVIKKEIARFSFDSQFGTCFIMKYITECGKLVMYSGGSPTWLEKGDKIAATIKHNSYKNINQTLLQRIKIIN